MKIKDAVCYWVIATALISIPMYMAAFLLLAWEITR